MRIEYLILLIIPFIFIAIWMIKGYFDKANWKIPVSEFPKQWKVILTKKVAFYNALDKEEKNDFEYRVHEFILNYHITGIDVLIDDTDRLLTASSAIIPIFTFPKWRYFNLSEVLIYPNNFNYQYETAGPGRNIQGMVGTGIMEGKMILSKPALRKGFKNETDKHNVAIHEFVHLIDKSDGVVDGIPLALMNKQYAIPWMDLIDRKIRKIKEGDSKINTYGASSRIEFFAVLSEYFFERPKLLEKKHPELYDMLEEIFNHDMAERSLFIQQHSINRNDPCVCGSGRKFKKCCRSTQ